MPSAGVATVIVGSWRSVIDFAEIQFLCRR